MMEQALMRPQQDAVVKWIPRTWLPQVGGVSYLPVAWLLVATVVALLACCSMWQLARLGVKRVGRLGARLLASVQRVRQTRKWRRMVEESTQTEATSTRRLHQSPTPEPRDGRTERVTSTSLSPERRSTSSKERENGQPVVDAQPGRKPHERGVAEEKKGRSKKRTFGQNGRAGGGRMKLRARGKPSFLKTLENSKPDPWSSKRPSTVWKRASMRSRPRMEEHAEYNRCSNWRLRWLVATLFP